MMQRQIAGELFIQQVTRIIEDNLGREQFGTSELAVEMKMSRSNLHRRIKSITGKSTNRFIKSIRLGKAMALLNGSGLSISEIAFKVGFGSASYFSKCFHEQFGFPPGKAGKNVSSESSGIGFRITQPNAAIRKRKHRTTWIISGFLVLIIAGLILTFAGLAGRKSPQVVVIAVLHLQNDNPDGGNEFIINALIDEILNKLSLIDEFDVIPRRISDTYRDSEKDIRTIGRELNAQYILEVSVTKLNQRSRIHLQLIETSNERNLWTEPYEREITLENLFEVPEEIAMAVTDELRIILKREDEQKLELTPSDNLEAFEAFILAKELDRVASLLGEEVFSTTKLRSKQLLEKAVTLDSTFAGAYAWLGHMYIDQFYNYFASRWDQDRAYACLDTGIHYIDKALSFYMGKGDHIRPRDVSYYFASNIKGNYYLRRGMHDKAEMYHTEGNKGNAASYLFHSTELSWYTEFNNFAAVVEHYFHYLELKPKDVIVPSWIHYIVFNAYRGAGFPAMAREQSEKILMRDGDSLAHMNRMGQMAWGQGDYIEEIRLLLKLKEMDPGNSWYDDLLIWPHTCIGNHDEVVRFTKLGAERLLHEGIEIERSCFIGYGYTEMGERNKALPILQAKLDQVGRNLNYPTKETQMGYTYLYSSRFNSILGNREKTLEYLSYLDSVPFIDVELLSELKYMPSYDLVRNTPEFRKILKGMESKYNREHDKIEKLLRQHGV